LGAGLCRVGLLPCFGLDDAQWRSPNSVGLDCEMGLISMVPLPQCTGDLPPPLLLMVIMMQSRIVFLLLLYS